jgi:hypothetical protein
MVSEIVVFLDTETLGLDVDRHAPWELAWTVYLHDQKNHALRQLTPMQSYFLIYTPEEWAEADLEALKINHFVERFDRALAVSQSKAMNWLRESIGGVTNPNDVVHLCGSCPWFDQGMLARYWTTRSERDGLMASRPWHYHLIDVSALAGGALRLPPPFKHNEMALAYGIDQIPKDVHTAEGDVRLDVQLYAAVYSLIIVPLET